MAVRESLLALLIDGPKHGYQLRTEYDAATVGAKPLNIGQVYTTLDRLERDDLVEPAAPAGANGDGPGGATDEPDGRRKRYRLTARGRTAAERWFASPTATEDRPTRDELTTKVVLAVDAPGIDALEVVRIERHALVARLQTVHRRTNGDRDRGALADELIADAAAARIEAALAWLDRCEARLRAHHRKGTNR